MGAYKTKGKRVYSKIQAALGTAETPDGTNFAKTMNAEYGVYEGEVAELNYDVDGAGNSESINLGPEDTFSCDLSMTSSGTLGDPPPFDDWLRACGLNATVDPGVDIQYSVVDILANATEALTIWQTRGNKKYSMYDAMGNMGFELKSKQFPKFMFNNFVGVHVAPSSQVELVPDLTGWVNSIPMTKNNTPQIEIGGEQFCVDELSFDMGNTIETHDRSGCSGSQITERSPTGKLVIEAPDIASINIWPDLVSHEGTVTLQDVVFQHGTADGSVVFGTIHDCQITKISEVDLNGTLGYQLDLKPIGDDILTLGFR